MRCLELACDLKPLLHIGGFRRRSTAVPKPWWSANERHEAPTEPQVNATKRQWWRWPYGSFELFKTSAVERRSQVCPSWSAAKRRQLCAIVGERTGTATRRRGAQPLGTAVELQQAAFADAPLRPTAVLRRLCAVLIHHRDGLVTTCCAPWRTTTPRGRFTML